MKKNLDINPVIFPMPVMMIGTYDENGNPDVMNAGWGGTLAEDVVILNIDETHKTADNLKLKKAFTLALPTVDQVEAADFFGIASAHKVDNKIEKAGMSVTKSEIVDAPIVNEFPLTMECDVLEIRHEDYGFIVIGKVKGIKAEESILNEKGKVDPTKLNTFAFDNQTYGYFRIGEKLAQGFKIGARLLRNK